MRPKTLNLTAQSMFEKKVKEEKRFFLCLLYTGGVLWVNLTVMGD